MNRFVVSTVWPCLFALLLAGCAGQEKPDQPPMTLTELSRSVLAEAIYLDRLLDQCAGVNGELRSQAEDIRTLWLNFHGQVLAGADAHDRAQRTDQREYRGRTLSLNAIGFRREHRQRATRELRLHERSAQGKQRVCERRLAELLPEVDRVTYLDPQSEHQRGLRDQLEEKADAPGSLDGLPSLAADVPPDLSPGRSFHQVEQALGKTCPDPTLIVVADDWPHEAYGALCADQTQTFMTCEWGECHTP